MLSDKHGEKFIIGSLKPAVILFIYFDVYRSSPDKQNALSAIYIYLYLIKRKFQQLYARTCSSVFICSHMVCALFVFWFYTANGIKGNQCYLCGHFLSLPLAITKNKEARKVKTV